MAIETQFSRMGARVKVLDSRPWQQNPFLINILKDKKGEYFEICKQDDISVEVIDVQPKDRHLLLLVRKGKDKDKFLCGHDERAWFVASVPGQSVSSVKTAKEALKPAIVRQEQVGKVKTKDFGKRHTEAYLRQGEWFFIPRPELKVDSNLILKNEPIQRGRSKPHICELLYRTGGTRVWVGPSYPNGLTDIQYKALDKLKRIGLRRMVRDAAVYVRGKIRHPDHKTIVLGTWCEVRMNTESESRAMSNVAFLD